MDNKNIKKLLVDLQKLKDTITIVIDDLEKSSDQSDFAKPIFKKAEIPSEQILREEWRTIQKLAKAHDDINKYINNFIEDKTKAYLRAFSRANDLPIQDKDSKDKIAHQLVGLLHIASTIIGRS